MASKSVIIVGAGLFGSIAAKLAADAGHRVTLLDPGHRHAASAASGCVLAPSWLSSLSTAQIDAGLKVLTNNYTVHPVTFQTNLLKKFTAARIDPDEILKTQPITQTRAVSIKPGAVTTEDGEVYLGHVLVCAGVWCEELLPGIMPKMKGLYGASLRITAKLDEPRINVYAPYRQAVGFQLNRRQVWFGDGTALIQSTWQKEDDKRIQATVQRGRAMVQQPSAAVQVNVGIRPYVDGHKAGYYVALAPRLHVSTGGAKNGTILAAYQAHRYLTEVLK